MEPNTLSPRWQARFDRFENAEPFGFMRFKDPSQLKLWDRHNIWAFLFGPLYYFRKGLFKKGLFMLSLMAVSFLILDLISHNYRISVNSKIVSVPGEFLYSYFANWDVYMRFKHGETFWPKLKKLGSWKMIALISGLCIPSSVYLGVILDESGNSEISESVSGNWANEADGVFILLDLGNRDPYIRINGDYYKIEPEVMTLDSLVLKNNSTSNPPRFTFALVWDKDGETFRLNWKQATGAQIPLDFSGELR